MTVAALAAVTATAAASVWLLRGHDGAAERSSARLFAAKDVPFVSDAARVQLQGYADAPPRKAIAVSRSGMGVAVGAESDDAAQQRALLECRNNSIDTPCELYALGDSVVWAKGVLPMPLPVDIRSEPRAETVGDGTLPLVLPGVAARIATDYLHRDDSRALAIGGERAGWAYGIASQQEATRRALERCADLSSGPCLLYALGDKLLQPLPRSRKIVSVFTFAGDTRIPRAERDELMKIYAGRDWRAIAHGANGVWLAVADEASEEDAVRDALGKCSAKDKDCDVFAIGNFIVK
jgi:hypothetical protein